MEDILRQPNSNYTSKLAFIILIATSILWPIAWFLNGFGKTANFWETYNQTIWGISMLMVVLVTLKILFTKSEYSKNYSGPMFSYGLVIFIYIMSSIIILLTLFESNYDSVGKSFELNAEFFDPINEFTLQISTTTLDGAYSMWIVSIIIGLLSILIYTIKSIIYFGRNPIKLLLIAVLEHIGILSALLVSVIGILFFDFLLPNPALSYYYLNFWQNISTPLWLANSAIILLCILKVLFSSVQGKINLGQKTGLFLELTIVFTVQVIFTVLIYLNLGDMETDYQTAETSILLWFGLGIIAMVGLIFTVVKSYKSIPSSGFFDFVIKFVGLRELFESEYLDEERKEIVNDHQIQLVVKSYLYNQLQEVRTKFEDESSISVNYNPARMIEKNLSSRFSKFVEYVNDNIRAISQYQENILWNYCLELATPIQDELDTMIQNKLDEIERMKRIEVEKIRIKNKQESESLLFGKSIDEAADEEVLAELRPVSDMIDDLLGKYAQWEETGQGKLE